jgi:hypothetical protein
MVKTTKAQRAALKRVWEREQAGGSSYRRFRKLVQPTIGCDGAVAVPWNGMWLCIETDGYTHS